VVSFTPLPLCPQGRATDTHRIGDWTGCSDVLDAVVKEKFPVPPEIEPWSPNHPARILVAIELEMDGIVIWNVLFSSITE